MTFFDIINAIYLKNKKVPEIENGMLIVINKWLSWDKNNLVSLRRVLPYLFFIEPLHYYYLLYFNIPKRLRVPFLKKMDTKEAEDDELVKRIQYVLGWSNRELRLNRNILNKTVLNNKKKWKTELGIGG